MIAQELIDITRRILDDSIGVVPDLLWTDIELLEHANDGVREAAIRSRLIVDSTTASLTALTIVGGTSTYSLDSRVIDVVRAKIASTTDPALHKTTKSVLDLTDDDWESTTGIPRSYLLEDFSATTKLLRLYPNPTAPGSLNITIVRLPLADMAVGDVPEIPEHLHSDLKYWMLYRAFQKQDTKVDQNAKTVSLKKEQFFLGEFEKVFGQRSRIVEGFTKPSLLVE